MSQYRERYQLKNMAKDRLLGKYPEAILLFIISGGLRTLGSMLAVSLVPFQSIFGVVLTLALSLLFAVILNVLQVGSALFFLNVACGQPHSLSNLFYGFREQSNKCLAISGIICGLLFLFELPAQIYSLQTAAANTFSSLLSFYGLELLAQLLFLPFSLALSQCYYLILDYPNLSAIETVKMSLRIMKGNKLRLFILQLSFLPLMLLSYLSFAIGFLWLTPYMQMTFALFFLDLMAPKNLQQETE